MSIKRLNNFPLNVLIMTSGKYFNKGVKTLDEPNVGFVARETPDKIVIFGEKNERYDVPITEIQQVGANVLLGLKFGELKKYAVPRNSPLPSSRKDPWEDRDSVTDLASMKAGIPTLCLTKGLEQKMRMMLDTYSKKPMIKL